MIVQFHMDLYGYFCLLLECSVFCVGEPEIKELAKEHLGPGFQILVTEESRILCLYVTSTV